jgi:hypothetical protein
MFRDRNPSSVYLQGINLYVPGMQYASELVHGQPTDFSLGSPAAQSATAFLSAANAQTLGDVAVASASQLVDSRYGRNVRLSISGDPGNAHVIDVYGFDYLGQPMVERFTGASGVTSILYGKKAFYRVTKAKVVTASSNAVTFNLGTGSRLGLPFKGDIIAVKEAGVQVQLFNRDFEIWADRAAAKAVAGGSEFLRAPCPGYVKTLLGTPNGGGSTTDPVITVELGGVAITGLTVTIDTSNAAGLTVSDAPTTIGYNANNRFVTNDMIELVGAAAASAGSDRVGIVVTPTQFVMPDLTDPATATTGDPRGTYEALRTLDGSEIIVSMIGNNAVNADNNGGLHGLKHFGG